MSAVTPVISFECTICFLTSDILPKKYKCTACSKKICDACFSRHIKTKNTCVFCRAILEVKETDEPSEPPKWIIFCKEHQTGISIICWFMLSWYSFMFIFLFRVMPRDRYYSKPYNITN